MGDYLLLAMRLFWGWGFVMAGLGKFGDMALVAHFFSEVEIPFPLFSAYLVAIVEVVGGACLITGFVARKAAIPLAIIMVVALLTAHHSETFALFENPQRFISQLPFNYLLTCLIVISFGAGRFSVDNLQTRL